MTAAEIRIGQCYESRRGVIRRAIRVYPDSPEYNALWSATRRRPSGHCVAYAIVDGGPAPFPRRLYGQADLDAFARCQAREVPDDELDAA